MRIIEKFKKNYFLLFGTFLFIYIFFNLLDGERGLISYFEKKDKLSILENTKNSSRKKFEGGFILIGDVITLSKICNGVFFEVEKQGVCMVGKRK